MERCLVVGRKKYRWTTVPKFINEKTEKDEDVANSCKGDLDTIGKSWSRKSNAVGSQEGGGKKSSSEEQSP